MHTAVGLGCFKKSSLFVRGAYLFERDSVLEKRAEALCTVHGEIEAELMDKANATDLYRVVVLVKSGMVEKRGRSNGAQKYKYRSIVFNIKDTQNPELR
ncbi:Transcription elongation factor S-II, central domain-containing protein [Artemisia annua]|uniref:Transcription elongation factor S-II, central domain-containing protein n=1 Tax=Artemisia annua TaxID=35608 RepID=A0A2U1QKB4_ARTAN|nr:Transcription elongation factor S-II, central domain-containing protein [Artemisia annua]